jgi:hypothetical protein
LGPTELWIILSSASRRPFVVDYLPSPFGRRAGDEGIEAKYFLFILVFSQDSLNSKEDLAKPHPNPVPKEREQEGEVDE